MTHQSTTPSKGITAKQLFAKSDNRIIQDIVLEQVKIIDAQLLIAHGAGFNQITHELPTNFSINSMNKEDAQIMIYSELLMMYKNPEPTGKGFEKVYLELNDKKLMHIHWINGMDQNDREVRKKYIQQCVVQSQQNQQRTQRRG